MKIKISKYLFEIYYILISILFFLVVRYTWFFRKLNEKIEIEYNFNIIKYTLITGFVFFTIRLYRRANLDLFSKNIIGIVLVVYFIPSSIFYSSTNAGPAIYLAHVALFFTLFFAMKVRYDISLPILSKKQSLFILVAITVIGVLPFLRYIQYINIKNLFLIDIYITRFKFRRLFDVYSSYSHSWFTRVIIPVIFVFALKYRLRLLAFFNILILLMLYLMGAVKSVLLGSLLVVLFYFLPAKKIMNYIVGGLISLAILAIVSIPFFDADNNMVAVIIFRRLMFIPSLLDYAYVDFFDDNHLYWSSSFLKGFIAYPYNETPARLIGDIYFDRPDMAANNGIISDGFANAGFIGSLLNIFFLSSFFSIVKNSNVDIRFFGIFFFFIYNIFTTTFSTVLVTHGGIILLLLTLLVLRNKKTSDYQ
jgi:hypothetical protein